MTTPDNKQNDLDPTPAAQTGRQGSGSADSATRPDQASSPPSSEAGAPPRGGTDQPGGDTREPLVSEQRSKEYKARWNDVKGGFVDEPRQAVAAADQLVGELLDELQDLFRGQRRDIEQSLDSDQTNTEDLRLALSRYRSFFDRLLSV